MIYNGDESFTCEKIDDKEILTVKHRGASPDEVTKLETDGTVLKRISSVIDKYKMDKWNGFNENNPYVLDGGGFSLTVKAGDEILIDAYGINSFPKNYGNATNEIISIIQEVLIEN
ncbi:MAG: hypothetical protein ACI4GZ_01950 [Ruminococcus sp.]